MDHKSPKNRDIVTYKPFKMYKAIDNDLLPILGKGGPLK